MSAEPAPASPRHLLVALLTPFDTRGRLDLARLRAHVLWLVARGIDGFVPTAAPGEFLYLSDREREAVHRTVLDTARGRIVIPCTWDPSPVTMAFLTDAARDQGASGVLLCPPLGVEVDDRLVRLWFETAAQKGVPVWLYHEPPLMLSPLTLGLYEDLRRSGLVVGRLDTSDDLHRISRLARSDPNAVYAMSDRLLSRAMKVPDLCGAVSTLGNAWPSFCRRLFLSGEVQLEDALLDRVNGVRAAGGLRALKSLLRMPCRAPLVEPLPSELTGLPPAETI